MRQGEKNTFHIERLTAHHIVADELASGAFWYVRSGMQDVRGGDIVAGANIPIGPYIANCSIRIECVTGEINLVPVVETQVPVPFNGVVELVGAGSPADNTFASLQVDPEGADNAISYEAKIGGAGGNLITIAYEAQEASEAPLSIVTIGWAITVKLEMDGGEIASTAADIVAAFADHPLVSALIDAVDEDDTGGVGIVTEMPATALVGGSNGAGRGVASRGSRYTDIENGDFYINRGTADQPDWSLIALD